MQFIADLQLHSKYSRAVSLRMDLFEIVSWAAKKGIQLVATGDWTHPLWFRHLTDNLAETAEGSGLFQLKKPAEEPTRDVIFFLSTEISSIYSQGGKTRRVHNLVFSPSISACQRFIKKLQGRGANLMADGRPIVGISAKELLAMCLEVDERMLLIPAHAWTPWFSIFGSKSGFDSIKECFEDLSSYIYAVETGLSSDPIMNWQIKELDSRAIVSFSDAHSGPKLGREATVFITNDARLLPHDLTYDDISAALKQETNSRLKIGYTIEFFPEEGKYHWSGHRACNVRYSPPEVKEKGTVCPVCHRPLTIGVENRVIDLSSQTLLPADLLLIKNKAGLTFVYDKDKKRRPFVSAVPLLEVLLEINHHSPTAALYEYHKLTASLGSEFDILLRLSYETLEKKAGIKLRQAIEIVRDRKVSVDPGYDGVFGKVHIFKNDDQTLNQSGGGTQTSLF
ncbi:DNA helicase UvrD [Candidatus Roizmanbacteria bacterium]|nr:DNA helicase UvrD [Candidatus Roizmanbacteria bacterium]